jgi:hypothetical protein
MLSRAMEENEMELTDKQQALLLQAAARDDGAVVRPQGASKASAARVAASLIALKLLRTCKAKAGLPIWRKDANGESLGLILTKAGRAAADRVNGKQAGSDGSGTSLAREAARREDRFANRSTSALGRSRRYSWGCCQKSRAPRWAI